MRMGSGRLAALLAGLVLITALAAHALTVAQRGNQILLDGMPTALTFARGYADASQLPAYRALGFNTLLLSLDSPLPEELDKAEALVTAAEAANLYVLIEFTCGDWFAGHPAAFSDEKYQEDAALYIEQAVERFKAHPRVVGWIISTVEEGQLAADVGSFANFMQEKYGTITALNKAWSYTAVTSTTATGEGVTTNYTARVPSFSVLTERTAGNWVSPHPEPRKKMTEDIDAYRKAVATRDKDLQRYLRLQYKNNLDDLNKRWQFDYAAWDDIKVDTIRAREKKLPNSSPFSQLELACYRAALPRQLIEWWARKIREKDAAHLVFAGQQHSYRTLISLSPAVNGALVECYPGVAEVDRESHNPHALDIARRGNRFIVLAGVQAQNATPAQLSTYLYTAAFHGAAGLLVQDWPALAASAGLAGAVHAALVDMYSRGLLNRMPAARIAFVYSPFTLGPPNTSRPLYGYMSSFLYYGPGMFFFTLRQGTCYGQVDYLAAEDLAAVPLERYRVILLPTVFDLPDSAQDALTRFVTNGGTAIADLGLGTLQATGNYQAIPPKMMELFGVSYLRGLKEVRYNLEVYRGHPRFPHLLQGLRTTGIGDGYMVARAAEAIPLAGTDLLFQMVATTKIQPPTPRPRKPLPQKWTRGLFIVQRGKGFALFAPFPLYHLWMPGTMLFEEFHRDLFANGADAVLERPIDFLPTLAGMATYADGSIALWSGDETMPVVSLANPERRAYDVNDGRCDIMPGGTQLRGAAGGLNIAEPLAVYVADTPFTVSVSVLQANSQGIVFDLGSPDEQAKPVALRVGNGSYPVTPGSKHRVIFITPTDGQDVEMTADARGWLTLTPPAARCRVMITGTAPLVDIRPPVNVTPFETPFDLPLETPIDVVPERLAPEITIEPALPADKEVTVQAE